MDIGQLGKDTRHKQGRPTGRNRSCGKPSFVLAVPFPRRAVTCYHDVEAILGLVRASDIRAEGGQPVIVLPSGNSVRVGYSLRTMAACGATCRGCGRQTTIILEKRVRENLSSLHAMSRVGKGSHWIHVDVDHLVPRWIGGASAPGNLLPLCEECGSRKGDEILFEFEPRFRVADLRRRLQASRAPSDPAILAFEREYVSDFRAARDFGEGYLTADAFAKRKDDVLLRHGLACDPGDFVRHLFPIRPAGNETTGKLPDSAWLAALSNRLWLALASERRNQDLFPSATDTAFLENRLTNKSIDYPTSMYLSETLSANVQA